MVSRSTLQRELVNKQLRNLLAQARVAAGLTQLALAETLGRPQSFVSKYEHGERRLDIGELIEVAMALGLDPTSVVADLVVGNTAEGTGP
ncbi:MAG: helix-turn-helix transcriptional regulator [Holophagae bacterium]|nr:helix-turn-helix transcriptional regulator [Holophagae bacterium]